MNKHLRGSNERPNWVDFLIQTVFLLTDCNDVGSFLFV